MDNPIFIHQTVGMLVDGNNIDMGIHQVHGKDSLLNYLTYIPKVLKNRKFISLQYFREGKTISDTFRDFLKQNYCGSVTPCGKSADVALAIQAVLLANNVHTIIIFSGDVDFCPLVDYLKSVGKRVEIVYVDGTESKELLKKADDSYRIEKADVRQNK